MSNTNQGAIFTYYNGTYNIPLYPKTTSEQVEGLSYAKAQGPIQITLNALQWQNQQQTVTVQGVSETDLVTCINILSSDVDVANLQSQDYNLLDPEIGVNTIQNGIVFTCSSAVPTTDLTLQIDWIN